MLSSVIDTFPRKHHARDLEIIRQQNQQDKRQSYRQPLF